MIQFLDIKRENGKDFYYFDIDNIHHRMVMIGDGSYATAYHSEIDDRVYQFVSGCRVRDLLCGIKMPHVPHFEFVSWGYDPTREIDTKVYVMPYYDELDFDSKVREYANLLRRTWNCVELGDGYFQRRKRFIKEIETLHFPKRLVTAIQTINEKVDCLGEDAGFEFPDRNLAVDEKGRLVLLDIAFDHGSF